MVASLLRFMGSIRLAVPLLVAIASILIWATFYEAQVGSATVQQQIYKSPWFGGLMFLLAVNLGISALSRYPWRGARKVGFALTHLGLIVLIAGSAAVIHLSVEGMLLVRTDSMANNRVRVEGELLEVSSPGQPAQQATIYIKPDSSVSPDQFAGFKLLNYQENTIKSVSFTNDGEVKNPAVRLRLNSDRMGQTLERWLALAPSGYRQMEIGPAQLAMVRAEDEAKLQQLLTAPKESATGQFGVLSVNSPTAMQTSHTIDVQQSLQKPLSVGDLQIKLLGFWPDFRLNGQNQPATASQQLQNPAVQLEISQGETLERWYIFAKPDFEPIRTLVSGESLDVQIGYTIEPHEPADYFRVIVAPNETLYYAARSSKGFQSGQLTVGQSVTPGWADFQISLADYLDHAQVNRQIVPVPPEFAAGSPALLVEAPNGQQQWLPWGEPTAIATSDPSPDPSQDYYAAFSPRMLELPFAVKLDDFIVERNEGSETVAMWTSQIRINDPHSGRVEHRNVWMNHPTWYQGWKIAQASWNPGDLQQSTLQVKREPLWVTVLTWSGSALVIGGIAVMFYGPGLMKSRKSRQVKQDEGVEGAIAHSASAPEQSPNPALDKSPVLAGRN